ncbi:MAG TPA: hypothetical protein VKS01_03830, partial [Bryobacteraceae bacterium]|nr:hypothetical protein [Bryobacteraceae bacterium]
MKPIFAVFAATLVSAFGQLAPPNDAGVSVGHVHLIVTDPDAQKKLWSGVLGAEAITLGPLELYKIPG